MVDIQPQSISANLAGTGQIGGQPAQPGERFLFLLPGLAHGGLSKLEPMSLGFALNNPPANPIASLWNSGAFSKKPGKPGLIDLAYEQQTMSKINAGGAEYMRFAVADVQPGNFQSGLAPVGGSVYERG